MLIKWGHQVEPDPAEMAAGAAPKRPCPIGVSRLAARHLGEVDNSVGRRARKFEYTLNSAKHIPFDWGGP